MNNDNIDLDYILKGTLTIEDTFYNDVLCRCKKCNRFSVYKKQQIENGASCKLCRVAVLSKKNLKPTTEMKTCLKLREQKIRGKYREGSKGISSATQYKQYSIGQVIGDLKITGFISKASKTSQGVGFGIPTEVIMSCVYCDYYSRIIDINDLDNYLNTDKGLELKCPHCSPLVKDILDEVKQFRINKEQKEKRKVLKRENKIASQVSEDNGRSMLIQKIKSPYDNVKKGSKLETLLDKIKGINKDVSIQDVEAIGSVYKVICSCNKCGTELVIPSGKSGKPVDCPGCERLKTDINYIGSYNKEYVGTTKNLLELLERNDDTCKVRCTSCGREHNNIRFYDWYKNKVICNCDKNNIDDEIICDNCGEYISVNLKDLIGVTDTTREVVCKHCGKESGRSVQELIDDYIDTPSMTATTSKKLGVARNKIKQSTTIIDDVLVKSKDPLYVGTDGNMYYKCICMKHNTNMVLNDEEIEMFSHEQCTDGRQHIMNDLSKETIS